MQLLEETYENIFSTLGYSNISIAWHHNHEPYKRKRWQTEIHQDLKIYALQMILLKWWK